MNPSDAADRLIRECGGVPPSAAEDTSDAMMDAMDWLTLAFDLKACPVCGSGALTIMLVGVPAHLLCDDCGYKWEAPCERST